MKAASVTGEVRYGRRYVDTLNYGRNFGNYVGGFVHMSLWMPRSWIERNFILRITRHLQTDMSVLGARGGS